MSKLKKNYNQVKLIVSESLNSLLSEALIVTAIISAGLIIELYRRLQVGFNFLYNPELRSIIFSKSISTAFSFTFVYLITKWSVLKILSFLSNLIPTPKPAINHQKTIASFLFDIFSILASILVLMPVRPIIQKINFDNPDFFSQAFVRFDAPATLLILLIPSVPLAILLIKQKKALSWQKLITVLLIIASSVWINHKPNYQARIYETRANWITQDFESQQKKAQVAMEQAETDTDKAIAYYWLGVASNRQGKHQEAIKYQLKAIDLKPEYGAPYSSLASAYLMMGELEKGRQNAKKCIRLSPQYAWCYWALSGYYANVNRLQQAQKYARKAVLLDKENQDLQNWLEKVEQAIKTQD